MATTTFSLSGLKVPATTRRSTLGTKFNLAEVQHALENMALASVLVGEHLLVINGTIISANEEPGIALMVLLNVESGVFLKRIWSLTVGVGRAYEVDHFLDACQSHFSQGKVCPGFLDGDTGRLSIACSNILNEGANHCLECQQVRDGEELLSIRVGGKRKPLQAHPSGGSSQKQGLREWAQGCQNIKDEDCYDKAGHEPTINTEMDVIKSHLVSSSDPPPPIMPIPANVLEMMQSTAHIKIEEDSTGTAIISEEIFQGEGVESDVRNILDVDCEMKEFPDNDQVQLSSPAPPLPSQSSSGRLPYGTYTKLIAEAIENSDIKALPLSSIYAYISKECPHFKQQQVRHQLSVDTKFQKVPRKNGRGCYWVIKGGQHDVKELETVGGSEEFEPEFMRIRNKRKFEDGLSCRWCDLEFSDALTCRTHLKQKHFWGKFRCTKGRCMTFNFARDIVDHMETCKHVENVYYNEEEPYVLCPNCKDAILIKDIVSHYEQCVFDNCQIFECPSCHKTFGSTNMLNRHWMRDHVHTKELKNKCNWCDRKFDHRIFLTQFFLHAQEKHLFGIFFCSKCPFKANFAKDLIEHIDKEGHDDFPIQCPSCKNNFAMAEVEAHYKQCILKYVRGIRGRYHRIIAKCEECGKTFNSKTTFKMHLKMHLQKQGKELFYYCDKCDKKFARQTTLRNHYDAEHEGRAFKCEECFAIFRSKGLLRKHKNVVHSTDEKFACRFCGKRHDSTFNREIHERSHQEPQFQCSICAKRLKSEGKLKAHERAHRGEKPFPCSICGAGFTSAGVWASIREGCTK